VLDRRPSSIQNAVQHGSSIGVSRHSLKFVC
jgi:hypothetical protein